MNKINILNFWYSLLFILVVELVWALFSATIAFTFSEFDQSDSGFIFRKYFSVLIYVPFLFWISKKTRIDIKDLYIVPEFLAVLKVLVVLVLVKFVVLTPIEKMDLFFGSLINSKIRIIGTSLRPIFPLLDFRVIILSPIVEEFFFRGIVLNNFLKKYSPLYAILLSSLLFGIAHVSLVNIIYYIALGALFGILYYKTNSLILATLAHMIWNACSIFNYNYVELNTKNSVSFLLIYATAVGILIILFKGSFKNNKSNPIPNKITN